MRSFLVFVALVAAAGAKPVVDCTINLDLEPEQRYKTCVMDNPSYNNTVWTFYNKYFAHDFVLRDVLYGIVDKRGSEPDEMQREINGLATLTGLPVKFVHGVQMLYELQTLMVPIVNFTRHKAPSLDDYPSGWFPEGFENLVRIPWRGPGCTGIIAMNSADNTVNHARNLDFAPAILGDLVFNGIFTKNGKDIFRSQMIAGYAQVITGANMVGDDGWAIERNTRYTSSGEKGNNEMIHNLLSGRALNGWQLRKLLESTPDYDTAVEKIKAAPYASTEYAIVSGVKKGTIISKNPDSVAHVQTLGQPNFDERDDYIIITNFDFFWKDVREWFDPTGGYGIGHPRRLYAQKILNATSVLTPEVLYNTINSKGVFADTIFQAIINVEKKMWNISQPDH